MGLFGKREKSDEAEIPSLPKLPKLPDFSDADNNIRQLPSFPSNSIGKRFSQDSIKDAVSGERGGSGFYADDSEEEEDGMMREPPRMPMAEEIEDNSDRPEFLKKGVQKTRSFLREEVEPVFVRIDKFEDGLKIFENVKSQISEIERMLADTKRLKEKEEAEIHAWEDELKKMRDEIEKIGMSIFSKV